jgi:hypothetical protein
MGTVKVYQFRIYDVANDDFRKLRRWATREAIELVKNTILEGTEVLVDADVLGPEVEGMTERDFDPHRSVGFQQFGRV